jgi:hypothetical protein
VEPETERLLNRLFETSARRSALAKRPAPGDVPGCVMSDADKATAAALVKVYALTTDLAAQLADALVLDGAGDEVAQRAVREVNELVYRLPNGAARRAAMTLRNHCVEERARPRLSPEKRKEILGLVHSLLDAMQPLESLVSKIAKYCLKLNLANEAVESALDTVDDVAFAREVRAALG